MLVGFICVFNGHHGTGVRAPTQLLAWEFPTLAPVRTALFKSRIKSSLLLRGHTHVSQLSAPIRKKHSLHSKALRIFVGSLNHGKPPAIGGF